MSQDPTSVRTEDDGAVVSKIVGDTATNQVAVDASGQLNVDVTSASAEPFDVSAAEVDVDINSQTLANIDSNLNQVGGTAQSGVDIAQKIDDLEDALASVGTDSFLVDSNNPLDVSASEVDVDINSQTLGSVTVTDDGSFNSIVEQASHDNLNANANIQVGDTDVDNSNPVPVTDVGGGSGTPVADYQQTSSISGQTSETLNFAISSSTTAEIRQVTASAEVPYKAEVQTYNGTTATTVAVIHGEAGETSEFQPETLNASLFAQANTGAGEEFRVVATNNNKSGVGQSAAINVTFEHTEE